MKSWGMNQPNTCSNCSIQLGNQISILIWSVATTMAPCLCLFVCEAEQLEEKRRTEEGSACLLSGASLSPSHPLANPSGLWGEPGLVTALEQSTRSLTRHAQLYLSPACLLILICKEAILFPALTGCLNGPLISLKWQSVNMHKKGTQLVLARLTAAWFHWQL